VGLRVTNEGTPYAFNFIYTRWAAAACKHYGAPFGNEPWGGDWSAIGNVGRMYNAMTSGADQFWTYAGHLHTAECIEAFRRFRHLLKSEETMVDVAVYYPKLHFALTDEHAFGEDKARSIFWAQGEELRDLTDFDIVDSTLIGDGALERYRFLILLQGKTMKRADLEQIEDWLKRGGVLVSHDFGPICDEAGEEWRERLLGGEGEQVTPDCLVLGVGSGAAVSYTRCADLHGTEGDHKDHPATEPAFLEMIAGILRWPQSVLHDIAPRIEPDCEMDGVFATRLRDAVLYLNTNAGPVAKRIAGPGLDQVVRVPGYSILRVPLDLASRAGP
jgi:hypothetical protein